MVFNTKVYDILKWIAQFFLPSVGTLYFGISKIWNLPYGAEIVGTITAVDAFLGILLGISSASYIGEGTMQVDTTKAKNLYKANLSVPVEDVAAMKLVTLMVNPDAKLDADSQG